MCIFLHVQVHIIPCVGNDQELRLSPKSFIIDFEQGAHSSIVKCFSDAAVFSVARLQAWYSKILQLATLIIGGI